MDCQFGLILSIKPIVGQVQSDFLLCADRRTRIIIIRAKRIESGTNEAKNQFY